MQNVDEIFAAIKAGIGAGGPDLVKQVRCAVRESDGTYPEPDNPGAGACARAITSNAPYRFTSTHPSTMPQVKGVVVYDVGGKKLTLDLKSGSGSASDGQTVAVRRPSRNLRSE